MAAASSPERPEAPAVPDALPVLPMRDSVVLPLAAAPLVVGQAHSVQLVDDVMRGNRLLALVAQRDASVESAGPDDLQRIGVMAVIHQLARAPDGTLRLLVQGLERIRLVDWVRTEPYLVARVAPAPDSVDAGPELDGLRRAAIDLFRRLVGPDRRSAGRHGRCCREAARRAPGRVPDRVDRAARPRRRARRSWSSIRSTRSCAG